VDVNLDCKFDSCLDGIKFAYSTDMLSLERMNQAVDIKICGMTR